MNLRKMAVLCTVGVLCLGPMSCAGTKKAASSAAANAPALMATIYAVDAGLERVSKTTFGTAKFTQGVGKVDVLVQVNGVPLGGREASPASDGAPATVPFDARVVKGTDCATVAKDTTVIAQLPQLRVQDDGAGVLMTSLDKVTLDQLAGQLVLFSAPGDSHARVSCGVIGAK
jgi:Cu/Zn superoxide dismutase